MRKYNNERSQQNIELKGTSKKITNWICSNNRIKKQIRSNNNEQGWITKNSDELLRTVKDSYGNYTVVDRKKIWNKKR